MFNYTVETITATRTGYHFTAPTAHGERLYVELTRCTDNGSPRSVPALWYNHGYTPERLADWWDVKTYATDDRGNCLGRYNPTNRRAVPVSGRTCTTGRGRCAGRRDRCSG